QHSAESRNRVSCQGILIGLEQGLPLCESAGVVVLEDGEGGGFILKLVHQVHGSIHVQQVVVRELFSVKLVEHLAEVSEEITLLMRVLAITQFLAAGIALFKSDLAFIEEVEDGS